MKQNVIIRTDILCKKDFAEKFGCSRVKLDSLIREGMIPGEVISNVFYCSIADMKAVGEALSYKNRSPAQWHRPQDSYKERKKRWETEDDKFNAAWEAYEAEQAGKG